MQTETILQIIHLLQTVQHPCRIAITGGRHVGKTTALMNIYNQAIANHLDIDGFIEKPLFDGTERTGYQFVYICAGETCAVAKRLYPHGYEFYEDAWQWAEQKIQASENHAILLIDELGLLESQNKGLMPALRASLARHPRHIIAAVRNDVLEKIESILGAFDKIYII